MVTPPYDLTKGLSDSDDRGDVAKPPPLCHTIFQHLLQPFRQKLANLGLAQQIPADEALALLAGQRHERELWLKVGDGGIGWHIKALLTRRRSR